MIKLESLFKKRPTKFVRVKTEFGKGLLFLIITAVVKLYKIRKVSRTRRWWTVSSVLHVFVVKWILVKWLISNGLPV